LRYRGKLDDSEDYLEKALTIASKEPIRDAGKLAEIRSNRGVLLAEQGHLAEAKVVLQQSLAGSIKAFGDQNPIVAADRYKLARVLIVMKEWEGDEGADALLAKSEEVLMRVYGEDHLRTAKCFEALADLRLGQQRHGDAALYASRVLAIRERTLPAPHPEIINTLQQLARIESGRGQSDAAVKYETRANDMTASHAARENAALAKLAGR
jgi:tetratricopeptide (TPR) repeat protein